MENKIRKQPQHKKPPVKAQPQIPVAVKTNTSSNAGAIAFFVLLAISFIIFANNFFNIKELTSTYIKTHASWVISAQFVLYVVVYGVFGYFGFSYIKGKSVSRSSMILMLVAFVAVLLLHYLAFNRAFEDVDDNASYMIAAKSLVDKGAPYYLYLPDMPPDTEGALGLPLMLIPFYLIWGMNYVPMEMLIFFTMAASVILSFLLFRKIAGTNFAVLITILFATHPYIVSFSSIIMTEIPYIFWSLLAIYLCLKFEEKPKINYLLLAAALLAIMMTYLTRAIGAGFVVAVMLYFLLKSNIIRNIKNKTMPFYKDVAFVKFILISALLLILFLVYQLWTRSLGGGSQAELLAKMSLYDQFTTNLGLVWQVFSQNIFCGKLARYSVNPEYLQPVNFLWVLIFLIVITGLVYSIIKKELIGLYFIFVMILLLVGNVAMQALTVSRYLIVFTPFMIYFLFSGIKLLISLADKKGIIAKTAGMVVLCFLLGNSFIGDAYNVQRSTQASLYSPPYQAFLDCAVWAKDNLPKESVVASRKERIFYIFSNGLRGYKHVSTNEITRMQQAKMTMDEFQQKKLEKMASYNTDYVIIDTFNAASGQLIYPIIEKNPDKFKLLKIIGDEKSGACYVFQVIKWWK
ncbi:MAG TPA: glycosyltransferase family 39 protein [Bacteroidales bacterium]|nr:glycosyltransferase family 39 protein [Bacteroidales bacterium]